ncbi:MAG: hypothetical protein L0Z54_07040, partial [Thermoplasmata archaeon]|nr:hypothetical protein [Thermoplasmata archaeon]
NDDFSTVAIFDTGDGVTPPEYQLRQIEYAPNGSVISESNLADIDGEYDTGDATVTCRVPKEQVPDEPGSVVLKAWAALWVTPSLTGSRRMDDEAMNWTNPGRNFSLAGLVIDGTDFSEVTVPGGTVVFDSLLSNPGSQNLTINCNHSYDHNWLDIHPEKWDVSVRVDGIIQSGVFEIPLLAGETASIEITIVVPEEPTSTPLIDGMPALSASIELMYSLYEPDNNVTSTINYQVLVNVTSDDQDGDSDDDDDDGWLPGMEAPVIALSLVAAMSIARRRRRN